MSIQTISWTKASLFLTFSIFLGALHICEKVAIPTSLNVFSAGMPQRDTCWAENVVHPTVLWHPFPRKVLIAGSATRVLVQQSLRHFTMSSIQWIDSSSPGLPEDDDILHRVVRYPGQSADRFFASENSTFDVVILDQPPSPELVLQVAERLAVGGVIAVALPDPWELVLKQALSVFKHVHLFTPYDSDGKSSYYAVATNSDAYPPPAHLSVAYVNTLIGRRVASKSSLKHYDGEGHLRMFLLRRQIRDQLRIIYTKFSRPASFLPNFAPFEFQGKKEDTPDSYPTVVTLTRDFVQCEYLPSSENDARSVVHQALRNGEAIRRGMLWNEYQNFTIHSAYSGVDTGSMEVKPSFDSSDPSPARFTVTAIFDGGSLSLHILPHLNLSRASITNFNGWVSPEEVLESLRVSLDPTRVSGSTHTGPPPLVHTSRLDERMSYFGDKAIGSVDYWSLDSPYWTSPKVELRESPMGGKGHWANEDIRKGEIVFNGRFDGALIHLEEYKRYPEWKKQYVNHYSEQAHDEVYSSSSRAQEDMSYYTNHACLPNMKYDDTYDQMVAIRDITAGEELTYDYATVSSEASYHLECRCGSDRCRHKVTGSDWEDEAIVAGLGKDAFWPYLKAKILVRERKRGAKQ